jgi:hypothetical protein
MNSFDKLSPIFTADASLVYNVHCFKNREKLPSNSILFNFLETISILSNAFFKSATKQLNYKFCFFLGLAFTYLSIKYCRVKILSIVESNFLKPPCSNFKIPFSLRYTLRRRLSIDVNTLPRQESRVIPL